MRGSRSRLVTGLVRLAAGATLATVVLEPQGASAMMLTLSLEDMSKAADVIAHGRVIRIESRWSTDQSTIYTDVTVTVARAVKNRFASVFNKNMRAATGSTPAEVVFRVPGGEVGDVGMVSSNDRLPQVGEELIMFLATAGEAAGEAARLDMAPDTLTVLGHHQGLRPVRSGGVETDEGRTVGTEAFLTTVQGMAR
jgi:hypothetical protein